MYAAWQRGISWLKQKTGVAVDPIESITIKAPMEKLIPILPGWIIQNTSTYRCLVLKEFDTKDQGKALVALLPGRAIVFRNADGSFMDTEIFPTYLLRDKVPPVQTIVCFDGEKNSYTWHFEQAPLFKSESLSEITDAVKTLITET